MGFSWNSNLPSSRLKRLKIISSVWWRTASKSSFGVKQPSSTRIFPNLSLVFVNKRDDWLYSSRVIFPSFTRSSPSRSSSLLEVANIISPFSIKISLTVKPLLISRIPVLVLLWRPINMSASWKSLSEPLSLSTRLTPIFTSLPDNPITHIISPLNSISEPRNFMSTMVPDKSRGAFSIIAQAPSAE